VESGGFDAQKVWRITQNDLTNVFPFRVHFVVLLALVESAKRKRECEKAK
jgi:hypothetical protein